MNEGDVQQDHSSGENYILKRPVIKWLNWIPKPLGNSAEFLQLDIRSFNAFFT